MPTVILHVSGDNFDAEKALSQVSFKAYSVYRKGDLMPRGKPNSLYPDSGFSVDLGPQDSDDLGDQIDVATTFIERHYEELKQITCADDLRLDFGYEPRRGKDGLKMAVQCDYFPPEFLQKCGELGIGIELSLYGAINEEGEPDAAHQRLSARDV
jgi:hypothetical protein